MDTLTIDAFATTTVFTFILRDRYPFKLTLTLNRSSDMKKILDSGWFNAFVALTLDWSPEPVDLIVDKNH